MDKTTRDVLIGIAAGVSVLLLACLAAAKSQLQGKTAAVKRYLELLWSDSHIDFDVALVTEDISEPTIYVDAGSPRTREGVYSPLDSLYKEALQSKWKDQIAVIPIS